MKSQSSVLYLLMLLLVPTQSEEQVIPSQAALLEQVKNLQPILESASIQGMQFFCKFKLQMSPLKLLPILLFVWVFSSWASDLRRGQLSTQPGVSKVGTNLVVCLLLPHAALKSHAWPLSGVCNVMQSTAECRSCHSALVGWKHGSCTKGQGCDRVG